MSESDAAPVAKPETRSTGPTQNPLGQELVGQTINDRFLVLSVLDHGGMGVIYRAEQMPLGRTVALKVLLPTMLRATDGSFRDRFFLEASTCARFKHPNTVTIYDFGEFGDGAYYIAMELLEGRSLKALIDEEGHLPSARAIHILRQVCGSLQEAHSLGIIHRDIKPANLFMVQRGDDEDFVKVLDFGLVKELSDSASDLTQQGSMMGSPHFMSPEQVRGITVDVRSDIYSLGAVIYYALCGQNLSTAAESVAIVLAHVNETPRSFAEIDSTLNIPPSIEKMVMCCLAKDPQERYQSLEELMIAINEVSQDVGLRPSYVSGSVSREQVHTLISNTPELYKGNPPDTHKSAAHTKGKIIISIAGFALVVGALILAFNLGREPIKDQEGQIESLVPSSEAASEILSEPEAAVLVTSVTTTPEGAALFLNGADLGDAPVELTIPDGELWQIEARMPGYTPRVVTLLPGQHNVNITLTAKARPKAKSSKPKVSQPTSEDNKPNAVKRIQSFIENKTEEMNRDRQK